VSAYKEGKRNMTSYDFSRCIGQVRWLFSSFKADDFFYFYNKYLRFSENSTIFFLKNTVDLCGCADTGLHYLRLPVS
jgi:hypothetical protein